MMAGHGEDDLAVGGPARHIPVLLDEVLAALAPAEGQMIVDGTFGAGGYTTAILATGASVVGDRPRSGCDRGRARARSGIRRPAAAGAGAVLAARRAMPSRSTASCSTSASRRCRSTRPSAAFPSAPTVRSTCAWRRPGVSAADVVNRFKAGDLARIFGFLGEERHAGRIARMIEKRRETRPFERTLDLADAIETSSARRPRDKIHPATRVFQALRIYVNDELGELARALFAAERVLKPGGRLVVVTFHSLEDRIVKRFIADRSADPAGSRHLPQKQAVAATFDKLGGVVAPSEAEIGGQSARPLGQAARGDPHRRAGARRRSFDLRPSEASRNRARGREVDQCSVPAISC